MTQTFIPSAGALLHVDISGGKTRLGGTALAQCWKQLGCETPDLDHPDTLKQAFCVTQKLITGTVPLFFLGFQ